LQHLLPPPETFFLPPPHYSSRNNRIFFRMHKFYKGHPRGKSKRKLCILGRAFEEFRSCVCSIFEWLRSKTLRCLRLIPEVHTRSPPKFLKAEYDHALSEFNYPLCCLYRRKILRRSIFLVQLFSARGMEWIN
jgi:hypothetical protein